MNEPFPLYVDEFSPDKIKATVSSKGSLLHNIHAIKLIAPASGIMAATGRINGISIIPVGRFICMLVGPISNRSMIMLDLLNKKELAERMAEKLSHANLRDRFMQVYAQVISRPENHGKFKLVLGRAKGFFSREVRY